VSYELYEPARDLVGEHALADSTAPGNGQPPHVGTAEQVDDTTYFVVAADERCAGRRDADAAIRTPLLLHR
jgi:hypothetical protein